MRCYGLTPSCATQCPNPINSTIGTSGNFTNATYFSSGAWVWYRSNPDETIVVPSRVKSSDSLFMTNITDFGQADASYAVLNGTRTVVVNKRSGAVVSRQVWSITNSQPGALMSSMSYSGWDDFDRASRADYLDGSYETYTYACCGLNTKTDRDGVTASYEYDPLTRRMLGKTITSYAYPISYTNVFDAAGRVVAVVRNGGGSWAIPLRRIAYDTADRVVLETNALSGVTTNIEVLDGIYLKRVTLLPEGGTITNLYYPDGSLYQVTGTATFPKRYEYSRASDAGVMRLYSKEIKLDASGNATSEYVTTFTDGIGRAYKVAYSAASGAPALTDFYNAKGQLERVVDPDNVRTLYRYNDRGELIITAVDTDKDGYVADYDAGYSGKDRVIRTTTQVLASQDSGNGRGMAIQRTHKTVWSTDNAATEAKVSTVDQSLNGLYTWRVGYRDQSTPVTTTTQVALPTAGNSWTRTITQTGSDNTKTVTVSQFGRVTSVTFRNSADGPVTTTTYTYDKHGRRASSTDYRGTASVIYNDADQVCTNTVPAPSSSTQSTITYYDKEGRTIGGKMPDLTTRTNFYLPNGLLQRTYGAREYAVGYSYDSQGRLKTMTNWSSFNTSSGTGSGARVTTWNYDPYRGWLASKRYPLSGSGLPSTVGPDYTYTAGGRLKTRSWARNGTDSSRIITTFTYGFDDATSGNDHSDLVGTTYSSNDPASTPAVSISYDRRGRRYQVARNGITTTLGHNDADLQTSEAYSGGTLNGLSVGWGFDTSVRRSTLSLGGVTTSYSVSYGYDTAGRLQTVSHGDSVVTYGYVSSSMLVGQITHVNGSGITTTTKTPDVLNRLQSISTAAGSATVSYSYLYNGANQRYRSTLADGSYWVYSYDALGQVQSGRRYWSDGTYVAGQQFDYTFDHIGNRYTASSGGNTSGGALQSQVYTTDYLNRYSSRTVPRYVQSLGTASSSAAIWLWTVNGLNVQAARKGTYFWGELGVGGTTAMTVPVTNVAVLNSGGSEYVSREVRTNYLPAYTESYGYDLDGNLTSDGRWTYTWDAENRLVRMVANNLAAPQQRLDFEYDWQGRRIGKKVWNNTSGSGDPAVNLKFLYDGWNLVAELSSANALVRAEVWGTDLAGAQGGSASMQGAGGVGGLLKVTHYGNTTTNAFAAYDGNGNVAALFDASANTLLASYEYGPFGEVIRATGPMAKANPFLFSTKYQDDETGLLYYGYRFYDAGTGRWVSRDPIEERGGLNYYGFVLNNPIGRVDARGLYPLYYPWEPLITRACRLLLCYKMIKNKTGEAEAWANASYGVMGGTHNTEGSIADMLTHCVASCELARNEGICLSEGYPVRERWQEREYPLTRGGNRMDYENNRIGFAIADSTSKDCRSGCLEAFAQGYLWTVDRIPPYRAHPVGTPKKE